MKKNITEIFGSMIFNDKAMRKRLSVNAYKELKKVSKNEKTLSRELADVVANAMKDWAIEKGATHFTHWFQPMTGITAEKHDSFLLPQGHGEILMEFSGKELIKGESDASSFPSGGLRATFEARGYTSWDPTAFAFIRGNTLYVPTAFCSYSGEALDKKTPLLRSMDELNKHTLRLLRAFGDNETQKVYPTVGAEQEYFLIDTELYKKRKDLVFCGRTLIGHRAPKDQQLEDHYFGEIKPKIAKYMEDLDTELWKLGIYAKTEHNEAAPSQYEIAPVFTTANVACDQNQITMSVMKTVAKKHGLTCLLHEKPFEGINGSGKHNNWSICTDRNENLLSPRKEPKENIRFLLFISAIVKAVDEYQDLLRVSVSTAGNDCRLGAGEAPPAIISVFLGEELTNALKSVNNSKVYSNVDDVKINTDTNALPEFNQDSSDRNRTSPFAFTGNKFEFRMLGASISITCPTLILNSVVADAFAEIADKLENAEDVQKEALKIIHSIIKKNGRIIFNGNNYSEEWKKEAQNRGLLNLSQTPDSMPYYISQKNIDMFKRRKIFSEKELRARYEITLDNYCKVIDIEAFTMITMMNNDVIPATRKYIKELSDTINSKFCVQNNINLTVNVDTETEILLKLTSLQKELFLLVSKLKFEIEKIAPQENNMNGALEYKDIIRPLISKIRAVSDEIEGILPSEHWPFPTYSQLLFSV